MPSLTIKDIEKKTVSELTEEDKEYLRKWLEEHRSKFSYKMDLRRRSKRVPYRITTWMRHPNKYDIPGVDTPEVTAVSTSKEKPKPKTTPTQPPSFESIEEIFKEKTNPTDEELKVLNQLVYVDIPRAETKRGKIAELARKQRTHNKVSLLYKFKPDDAPFYNGAFYNFVEIDLKPVKGGILGKITFLPSMTSTQNARSLYVFMPYKVKKGYYAQTFVPKSDLIADAISYPESVLKYIAYMENIRKGRLDLLPGNPMGIIRELLMHGVVLDKDLVDKARKLEAEYDPLEYSINALTNHYYSDPTDFMTVMRYAKDVVDLLKNGFRKLVNYDINKLYEVYSQISKEYGYFPKTLDEFKEEIEKYKKKGLDVYEYLSTTDTTLIVPYSYILGKLGYIPERKQIRKMLVQEIEELKKRFNEMGLFIQENLDEYGYSVLPHIIEEIEKLPRTSKFYERALPLYVNLSIILSDNKLWDLLKRIASRDKRLASSIAELMVNPAFRYVSEERLYGRSYYRNYRKVSYTTGECPLLFLDKYAHLKEGLQLLEPMLVTGDITKAFELEAHQIGVPLEFDGYKMRMVKQGNQYRLELLHNGTVVTEYPIDDSEISAFKEYLYRKYLSSAVSDPQYRSLYYSTSFYTTAASFAKELLSKAGLRLVYDNSNGVSFIYKPTDKGFQILYPVEGSYDYSWNHVKELVHQLTEKGYPDTSIILFIDGLEEEAMKHGYTFPLYRLAEEVLHESREPPIGVYKLRDGRIIYFRDGMPVIEASNMDDFMNKLVDYVGEHIHEIPLKEINLLKEWFGNNPRLSSILNSGIPEFIEKTKIELSYYPEMQAFVDPSVTIAVIDKANSEKFKKYFEKVLENGKHASLKDLVYIVDECCGEVEKKPLLSTKLSEIRKNMRYNTSNRVCVKGEEDVCGPIEMAVILKKLAKDVRDIRYLYKEPFIIDLGNLYVAVAPYVTWS